MHLCMYLLDFKNPVLYKNTVQSGFWINHCYRSDSELVTVEGATLTSNALSCPQFNFCTKQCMEVLEITGTTWNVIVTEDLNNPSYN